MDTSTPRLTIDFGERLDHLMEVNILNNITMNNYTKNTEFVFCIIYFILCVSTCSFCSTCLGLFHCFGCDPNRNWGFKWGTGGSSSNPCSDTYMGSEAFSEVENRNMRDFLMANKDQIKFYNNIHSYSQLVLLPWGWTIEQPDNYDDLFRMANIGNDALNGVHGTS